MVLLKKKIIGLIIVIISILISSCSSAMRIDLSQLYENTYHYQLSNGLTVILKETRKTPITAVHLRVNTGSIHEEDYYGSGLSHFFEHSLFLGSKNFKEKDSFSHIIESYGGADLNAYTTYDHTAYYCTVLSEYTKETLSAMSDLVFNPLFPKEHVKNEMGSIVSEMDMRNDKPDSVFNEFTSRLIFKKMPYQYPIIGFRERFEKLSVEELLAYYYKRYKPNNMILSVVGDFDAKEIIKAIDKHFGDKERGKIDHYLFEQEDDFIAVTGEITHPKSKFTRINFIWASVSYYDDEMYPLDVLAHLLSSGKGSILYERLKDDLGLIEDVSGYSWTPKQNGVFSLTFSLPILKDKNAIKENIAKIEVELKKILTEIAEQKIAPYRVTAIKRDTLTDFLSQLETTMGMARNFAGSVMATGGINHDEIYFEGIQNVNKESVAKVTKQFLIEKSYVKSILLPSDISTPDANGKYVKLYDNSIDETQLSQRDSINFKQKSYHQPTQKIIKGIKKNPTPKESLQQLVTKPNKKVVITQSKQTHKKILSNGLTTLYHQDKTLPKITIMLSGLGGVAFEEKIDQSNIPNGSFTLWHQMFLTSNEKYSRQELIQILKENSISLEPFSGRNSFGISLTFLKDNLKQANDILNSIILNRKYNLEDFNREKKELLFDLKAQEEQGWIVSRNTFIKLFFKDTAYANPPEGTMKSIKAITIKHLEELRKNFIHPQQMVFSAYGDISESELTQYFTEWLVKIPLPDKQRSTPSFNFEELSYQDAKSIHFTRQTGTQQTYLRMGYRAPTMTSEDAPAFHILDSYLSGMGGPLFKLRSEPFKNYGGGRAYQLGSAYSDSLQYGILLFYVALRYEASNEYLWAINSFQQEVEKIKRALLSDAEFQRAKLSIMGEELITSQRLASRAFEENLYELYGLGHEFYGQSFERLKNVTKENVKEVAKRYLKSNQFAVHVLMPKK